MLENVLTHCNDLYGRARRGIEILPGQCLPFAANSIIDRDACERAARQTWACAGRNGEALLRLAWARTQTLLEMPEVWKAVEFIEGKLFSGILWRELPDPRPGDRAEFAIEGEQVEALIASTDLRFGQFWQEHRCSPSCVRARPISKAFRKTVEQWTSESLKPETAKELCDAP
jgi:hypothetical protein